MSIIQIKRYSSAGESPNDRGATLAHGELGVNLADKQLWVGDDIGNPILVSAITFVQAAEPTVSGTLSKGALWFDLSVPETLKIWNGANWLEVSAGAAQEQEIVAALNELTDVSISYEGSYSGNVTRTTSTPTTSGEYQLGPDYIAYHNDQVPVMGLYQVGDLLTFTWADTTTTGPWTVEAGSSTNDPNSEFIRLVESGVNSVAGTDPLTITSSPDRSVATGDVLIYDGSKWVKGKGLAAIKEATAAATDFADFQARIAAL
jgi:hypothetical protein